MNLSNPHGWKAKRDRKRKRASHAPDEETREIRRRAMEQRRRGGEERQMQEPAPDGFTREESRQAVEAVVNQHEERKTPEDMDRDELTAELEAAGQTVGARAKDETLRKRVAELRDKG